MPRMFLHQLIEALEAVRDQTGPNAIVKVALNQSLGPRQLFDVAGFSAANVDLSYRQDGSGIEAAVMLEISGGGVYAEVDDPLAWEVPDLVDGYREPRP